MMSGFRTPVCVLFLLSGSIYHVHLQSDVIDAFDCLGTVIDKYKTLSMGCSKNIDTSCSHGEITCIRTQRSCTSWKWRPVKVSLSLRILSSNFINESTVIRQRCNCGEVFFNCSIESNILIENLVHDDMCSTSTLISAKTPTVDEITTNAAPTTSGSGTFIPTSNTDFMKDSIPVKTVTSYGAIFGALIGGVVLGAAIVFLIFLIIRRKSTPSTKNHKNTNLETVRHNPAYECSKDIPEKIAKSNGDIYTQIVDTKNCPSISALKPSAPYENNPIADRDTGSVYNHLHESKDVDRTDYYDHAHMISGLSPPIQGYETIQESNCSNTYTEVVGEGFRNPGSHGDQREDEYFVLKK